MNVKDAKYTKDAKKHNVADETNESNEIIDKSTNRSRKVVFIAIFVIFIGLIIYGGVWFMESYEPDTLALIAMQSTDKVTVDVNADYIAFLPTNVSTEPGLLFYPGAKVEPEAYSVMAQRIAEIGIPVIIVKMPFNFAVFDTDKAMRIKLELGLADTWAIGGHSLGGSMAAKVVYDHPEAFDALILFAAYPAGKSNDLSISGLKVLSIAGSRDALVTSAKIDAKKPFLPLETNYFAIEGGNHAQFGNYGPQKGDNQATLTSEAQMDQIVEAVVNFMGGLK